MDFFAYAKAGIWTARRDLNMLGLLSDQILNAHVVTHMPYPSLLSLLGRLKASGSHTIFDIAPPRRRQPVATSFETTASETDSPDAAPPTAASSPFEVPSAILAASIVTKGNIAGEEVQKFAVRLQHRFMTAHADQEAAKRRG